MAAVLLALESGPQLTVAASIVVVATAVGVVVARVARERMVARTDRHRHLLALDREEQHRQADRVAEIRAVRAAARVWRARYLSASQWLHELRDTRQWTAADSAVPNLRTDDMERVAGTIDHAAWRSIERAEIELATVLARQRVRLGAYGLHTEGRAAWTPADSLLADSALTALGRALAALAPLAESGAEERESLAPPVDQPVDQRSLPAPVENEEMDDAGRQALTR